MSQNTSLLDAVVDVVRGLKLPPVRLEQDVVQAIRQAFLSAEIVFEEEMTISPRCRVDFLVGGGVVVEVKKGKPNTRRVNEQVARYASCDRVSGVVLVSERGLFDHLDEAHGKPVRYVALSKNWGLTT